MCKNKDGCKYFIKEPGDDAKCYWEKTSSADCPEGWDEDSYDFYELKEPGTYILGTNYRTN